jgi:hypothetical protein
VTEADPSADWHAKSAEQVLQALAVDPAQGLSPTAAVQRLRRHGHNRLPAMHVGLCRSVPLGPTFSMRHRLMKMSLREVMTFGP